MLKHYRIAPRLFVIGAAILTLLLVTAACGGDDETTNGDETTAPTRTESSGDADETPEATEEGGDDESGTSDLGALAVEYGDFTGVVTYEVSGFEGSFTTMKIYRDQDRSRVDYEGTDGSGSFITNADGSFACSENQCIKFPLGQGIDPTAAFTAFIDPESIEANYADVPEGVNVEKSSDEIAGQDATCYDYSGDLDESEPGDEGRQICFAESGMLLRLDFTGASGGGTFEASEAEVGVSEADFEPPFDVVDLGDLGQ